MPDKDSISVREAYHLYFLKAILFELSGELNPIMR